MQTKREIQNGCPNQASNSGYALAKDKNERRMVEEKAEKTKQRQQTLSEKKEEAGNVSE